MNSVFISGIPASGKSYLAKKLSENLGIQIISTDKLRDQMINDPTLEPWVNFYYNLDEAVYYTTIDCTEQWSNLVKQSEAFWPKILEFVKSQQLPFVIEGVNLLPHLVKDFDFNGVYLLGESEEIIKQRLKAEPRWGETEVLQKMEAHAFINCEAKSYKSEAEKFGYQTFTSADAVYETLAAMISK